MFLSEAPCAIARTLTPSRTERAEHFRGNAVRAGHAIADDREDAATDVDFDALDLPFTQFAVERLTHDSFGARSFGVGDREADGMFRAALRDQDHGDAVITQRAEQTMRGAGTPIMPAPSRLISAILSMLVMPFTAICDVGFSQISEPAFSGAKVLRIQIGMLFTHRRRHGLRMDHLGAEVRQLHRFVIRERVDDLGIGHEARIGAEHAIDVGPDVNLFGVEQRAEDRAGEVAAVTAERRLQAVRIAGDEAGDDQRRRIGRRDAVHVRLRNIPANRGTEAGPHSTETTSRASTHCTEPGRRPR